MPWKPHYSEDDARAALESASTWKAALGELGVTYHGRNIATLRRWAARWGIDTRHLTDRRGTRNDPKRYTEKEAREAVAASRSWAETLRRLGYCQTGANNVLLKRRVTKWGISTDHFDPYAALRGQGLRAKKPLSEILVRASGYSRGHLKRRLYDEGLKERRCELCGQDETWRGMPMGLILDHKNGVRDDHRLENLRIICPNCAATLDTHCGRKNRRYQLCSHCGREFRPKYVSNRYCSAMCFHADRRASGNGLRGIPRPATRKVERPPFEQLTREIEEMGYLATGRKYRVSDNAIRKWVRQYEQEAALADERPHLDEAA